MVALTATVTPKIRADVIKRLDMQGCESVSVSPNRPNIFYAVSPRTEIETDLTSLVEDIKVNSVKANRTIVYCRSLNMCSDLYGFFRYSLGKKGYYPPDSEEVCKNRLFGMFHSSTSDVNKQIILDGLTKPDGTIRVVFATTPLGMGVNFSGLHTTIHYGAPRSLDDYFQESGRAGQAGEPSTSTIYWKPVDALLVKNVRSTQDAEIGIVRRYLENTQECGRYQLLKYFDPAVANSLSRRDPNTCCDCCKINCESI